MDELLSLFVSSSSPEAPLTTANPTPLACSNVVSPSATDDFSSSFGDAIARSPSQIISPSTVRSNLSTAKSNDTPTDPITGLRITDRRTSRADMIDAFSPFDYKSCSILAASSKTEWQGYMAHASKTNVATCGILTKDVGSRLSQKTGRAYAILNLGDLPAHHSKGPSIGMIPVSVTVFLFGDALQLLSGSKHYLRAGYAVAVLGPSVMGARSEDKSSSDAGVTLSVSDPRQVLLVGRCIDCDQCKGTVRKKTTGEFGHAKWEDVRCGTLIDARIGAYCPAHKRQGLSSGEKRNQANGSSRISSMSTFIQKQRMESTSGRANPIDKRNDGVLKTGSYGITQSRVSEMLSQAGIFENKVMTGYPKPTAVMLKRAPLHMKKSTEFNTMNRPNAENNDSRKANPYYPVKQTCATQTRSAEDLLGVALLRKRSTPEGVSRLQSFISPTSSSNKRQCKIFHVEGYDGSVQVPKPSKTLFHNSSSTFLANYSANGGATNLSSKEAQEILEKQQNVKQLLMDQKLTNSSIKQTVIANKTKDDPFASLFGQNDPSSTFSMDKDAILNAKSRFSTAATAEEYARARSVLQLLEVRETEIDRRKERTEKNKNAASGNDKKSAAIVTTGWICKTCKAASSIEPLKCVRAGHDVRQRRELKERKSAVGTRNDRMDRHGKETEDGGMTLGSGLEWSGWRADLRSDH